MNKFFIGFLVVLIVGGAFVYFYFNVEKKIEFNSVTLYNNLSIAVFDADLNVQIIANYTLQYNGIIINGSTLANDYILQQVPVNATFNICFSKEGYYTSCVNNYNDVYYEHPIRMDGKITKVGDVSLAEIGTLATMQPISVNISAEGYVTNAELCLFWSPDILTANINDVNFSLTEIDYRLKDSADKCYAMTSSLLNSNEIVNISFQVYGNLLPGDYIKTIFVYGSLEDGVIKYSTSNNTAIKSDVIGVLR